MNDEINKYILFNFFEGKTTLMQRVLIEKWLQEEAHQELYYQWMEEWENQNPQLLPDQEAAYQQSLLRIRQAVTGKTRASDPGTGALHAVMGNNRIRIWPVAASVVFILAALLSLWVQRDRILMKEYRTGYGEIKPLELPDGSRVVMNANTTLRVPRFGFGTSDREVVLSGEAKFSVVHTQSDRRFIVRTPEQLTVEVLGTEFVVFSRKRGSKVVLNKGKVKLLSSAIRQAKPLSMAPGDVVTIHPSGNFQVKHRQVVERHQAWEKKRFVFVDTSLLEISTIVKEHFGITLLLPDSSVANRTIGGTFKVTKPESLLRSLSEILELQLVAVDTYTYRLIHNKTIPAEEQPPAKE